MNTRPVNMAFIIVLLLVTPFTATAEDVLSEVLVSIRNDEVLAFSGPKNSWISHSLKHSERVLKKSQGNVAVVITDRRILGFSVFSEKWNDVSLMMNEALKEVQAEGNVATVMTDQRVFGFNAHTGEWVEAR